MGRKHAFRLWEDESNWWTGQLWKIGSPIWGLSKVWLIYLVESDRREGSPFPCFHSRQEGQARADWEEILYAFRAFLTPGLRVVKKKKDGWEKARTEWEVKTVRREIEGKKLDWQGQREGESREKASGRQMENKKQIGSPLISWPATHYATKQCASQGQRAKYLRGMQPCQHLARPHKQPARICHFLFTQQSDSKNKLPLSRPHSSSPSASCSCLSSWFEFMAQTSIFFPQSQSRWTSKSYKSTTQHEVAS